MAVSRRTPTKRGPRRSAVKVVTLETGLEDLLLAATATKAEPKKVTSNFVTLNGFFKVRKGTYEILKRNIIKGKSTLLLGETGVLN